MSLLPRVRDACQNCHRRKIRCLLTPGSSSCQHCSLNGSACLFAPRARAGRPRRTNPETQKPHQWEAKCSAPDNSFTPMVEDFGFQPYWTPDKLPEFDLPPPPPPPKPPSPFRLDFMKPDEAVDFDTILKLCSDLDRYCRLVREGMASGDMEALLKLLESTGATARSSTSEKASNALILAALYKVFDLCEAVVRDVLNGNQDHLDSLYRLKRLDLVLLQAKIALHRMGNDDAVKKSMEIHHWIESIVKQQQYQGIW